MKIWIDDERDCPPGWWCCRTFDSAERTLLNAVDGRILEAVSFDHDLGDPDPKKTGYRFAAMLEQLASDGFLNWFSGELRCHSANPVGQMKIQATIKSVRRIIRDKNK